MNIIVMYLDTAKRKKYGALTHPFKYDEMHKYDEILTH